MKANEAPEKIYFSATENGTHYYTEGIPFEREYIEYTRSDAFIEKACKWLKENGRDYATYDDSKIMPSMRADVNIKRLIKDFRKAMEE